MKRKKILLGTAAALFFALLFVAAWVLFPRVEVSRPNVLLISIDTLRPDHLGAYGYARATSPALDRFARDAVLFENAYAHAPSTLPSHASMLTALLPQHHRASHVAKRALPGEIVTLAEALSAAGYRTASFNGGGQLSSVFGLDQGFDLYRSLERSSESFRTVVDAALDWLRQPSKKPFFLFLHTYEVHRPFTVVEPYKKRLVPPYDGPLPQDPDEGSKKINAGKVRLDSAYRRYVIGHYDAQIASMDAAFLTLLNYLEEADLYRSTLILFTSDHGEELGERGQLAAHAHTLYEELLRVPLLLKPPGRDFVPGTALHTARGVDLLPTVLELAGLPLPSSVDGRSLVEALTDRSASAPRPRPIVAYRDTATVAPVHAIRLGRFKRIGGRLYDLVSDPSEKKDLAAVEKEKAAALQGLLEKELSRLEAAPATGVDLDPRTRKELEALGYL